MLITSRPPGRNTRLSSPSARSGSTAAWHTTSAAMAASKLASANGMALTLPRAIAAADFAAARAAANADHSSPTRSSCGRRARSVASNPPVPQPASSTRPFDHAQRLDQPSVQGAIPPQPVLGCVHQRVFGLVHCGGRWSVAGGQ